MEQFYPDLLANLSHLQEPAADVRRARQDLLRREDRHEPEDIFVVSIMPCTAKKFEAQRPEMYD